LKWDEEGTISSILDSPEASTGLLQHVGTWEFTDRRGSGRHIQFVVACAGGTVNARMTMEVVDDVNKWYKQPMLQEILLEIVQVGTK
jgi:hypothetical protein